MLGNFFCFGQGLSVARKIGNGFLSHLAWLSLALLMALLLTLALLGLAASGHFPAQQRAAALRSVTGGMVLYGAIAAGAACLVIGFGLAWSMVPWYAAVIGGGAVILFAPLVLQSMPDRFVDGYGALITFGAAATLLTLTLVWVGGAGS
jgi:hypothetical protein